MADFAERTIMLATERVDGFRTEQFRVWRHGVTLVQSVPLPMTSGIWADVVRASDHWLAFDAAHINDSGTGFRFLGCYATITAAKRAD